jgi:F420-dependent oxidoreductase-like protein
MAQQALTVQSATSSRFSLGIGLSHQVMVEGVWGMSFDRPARYMREYLDALLPMLNGQRVDVEGELLTARTFAPLAIEATPPSLLVAALAPVMLRLAGERADGTVTWMTGISTIASYVAPRLGEAAAKVGRPSPRIVVALPVCLTDNPARASALIDQELAIYPSLPSYKAMLDKEGVASASAIGLLGSAEQIIDGIGLLGDAGGTELIAGVGGSQAEREATVEFLGGLARG